MDGLIPRRAGSNDGVEDDEQFSHAGGHDDFESFALPFQALGEGPDDRVGSPLIPAVVRLPKMPNRIVAASP